MKKQAIVDDLCYSFFFRFGKSVKNTLKIILKQWNAILKQRTGVNLGAVYETVVAQELYAHGYKNYYYDRKKIGEVDFLVDDFEKLNVLPIEVKSGKESFLSKQ